MKNPTACLLLILMHLIVISCTGETLKELLISNHVPVASFSQSELAQVVQGFAKSNEQQLVLGYRQLLSNNLFVGPPHLLKYNKASGIVLRADLPLNQTDICLGSPGDIYFIGKFIFMSTDISPSAECLLVLDRDLKLLRTLYGFSPVEVAPNLVVIIEDMIHFARVHPERLQLADMGSDGTLELYPPKGDPLRAQLINEHAKRLPPRETCVRMNDPCDPDQFDEDIRSLTTDKEGRFAFLARQSANHATTPGEPPETVLSQVVLYIYQLHHGVWRYCQDEIEDSQLEALDKSLQLDFDGVASRCTPTLPVLPDLSTAPYNPFFSH